MKLAVWILLSILQFGCVVTQPVTLDRQTEALRLIDQGTSQLRAFKLKQAQASFAVAADMANLAAAYDGLGCVALIQGEFVKAEKHFLQAYNLDEKYEHSLGNLALLYEIRGLRGEAITLYLKAIEGNPKNFRLRNNFAAFLLDNYPESESEVIAKDELLKAQALVKHPFIEENLVKMK